MHFLELLYNLVGALIELVIEVLAAMFRPLRRRKRTAGSPAQHAPEPLPKETLFGIAIALRDSETDATAQLPAGWRGYYTGISDNPLPDDRPAAGDELRLEPEPHNTEREEAVRVLVELPDKSTVPIGYLSGGHDLGRSLELGRVRGWFAGRKYTLRNPAAALIFVAVYDP